MAIKKVGVVGGGLMGSGIAQTAAQVGYDVLMAEVNQELLDRGIGRVEGAWKMLSGKGRITEDQAGEYRGRFRGTLDLEEISDRDLVIEAIIENQDEKRKLFAQLDKITSKTALLVSNTSSLPIIDCEKEVPRTSIDFKASEVTRSISTESWLVLPARASTNRPRLESMICDRRSVCC